MTAILVIVLSALFFIKIFSVVVVNVVSTIVVHFLIFFFVVAHLVTHCLYLVCGEVNVSIRVMESSVCSFKLFVDNSDYMLFNLGSVLPYIVEVSSVLVMLIDLVLCVRKRESMISTMVSSAVTTIV